MSQFVIFVYLCFRYFEAMSLGAYRLYYYVKTFSHSFYFQVYLFGLLFFTLLLSNFIWSVSHQQHIVGFLSSLVLCFNWRVQSVCIYHIISEYSYI